MGVDRQQLTKLLTDLTSRNTYGAFSELAVYGILRDHRVPFDIQIPATARDILNPNGSDIDGCINLSSKILFDIKAFGLQERLVKLLTERLSNDFTSEFVAAEGSWDVPLQMLNNLLSKEYIALRDELSSNKIARRGTLKFQLRSLSAVQMTVIEHNPYKLAEENAAYAFNYAKQFARRKPFLLIFVIHPWLGSFSFNVNLADYTDTFTRAFARRTFMQFVKDRKTRVFGLTRGSASKLLSGIVFINAWPDNDQEKPEPVRLFLNPHAKHPMPRIDRDMLQSHFSDITVDDFMHDIY